MDNLSEDHEASNPPWYRDYVLKRTPTNRRGAFTVLVFDPPRYYGHVGPANARLVRAEWPPMHADPFYKVYGCIIPAPFGYGITADQRARVATWEEAVALLNELCRDTHGLTETTDVAAILRNARNQEAE